MLLQAGKHDVPTIPALRSAIGRRLIAARGRRERRLQSDRCACVLRKRIFDGIGGGQSSRELDEMAAWDVWICLKVRRCFRDFVASMTSQVASFSA